MAKGQLKPLVGELALLLFRTFPGLQSRYMNDGFSAWRACSGERILSPGIDPAVVASVTAGVARNRDVARELNYGG